MPPDSDRGPTRAGDFVLRGVAGSLGFFGLLRLPWIQVQVVLPLVRLQGALGSRLFGAPALPIEATLACSGADVIALCLGAVLAYQVSWPRRLAGAAGGVALILVLNTLRIGTLGRVAASPAWFSVLHLYVWPAALTLAVAGYVFVWMHLADGRPALETNAPAQPWRRFVVLTIAFVILFSAAAPLYLESPAVLALAAFIAHAAAATLSALGVEAHAAANVLWTARGGFLVTQECISTPLIPIYLAGVTAYATSWRQRAAGILVTLPLFTVLGVARLLVVALPAASPLFFVHAFYQLLLGVVVVCIAAVWRHGRRAAPGQAVSGILAGALFVFLLGPLYTRAVTYPAGVPIDDPQGAIGLLPAFQVGLYLALWAAAFAAVAWRRLVAGLAALGLTQAAGALALHSLMSDPGFTAPVRDVRAWAVAGPVLIVAAVVALAPARR